MDELVKALRYFIARDVLYIVGGGSVCAAVLYTLGRLPHGDVATWLLVLGAGIAYGAGYAIQEMLSLTPLLTTAPVLTPGRLVRALYGRFTLSQWTDVDTRLWPQRWDQFEKTADERIYGQFQRIIALKHVGSALGSNWLVVAGILGAKWYWCGRLPEDLMVGVATFLAASGLLAVAWLKGAEQTQHVWQWANAHGAGGSTTPG